MLTFWLLILRSQHLPCLKRVDLSDSKYLIETPDFEGAPNLERLDLSGCTMLSQVHRSIGLLKQLVFLSFRNCCSLVELRSLSNLSSPAVLNLSGCTKLERTPDFARLSNLEHLDLERCTSLSSVHRSIGDLANLKFLSLRDCKNLVSVPNSINFMKSLQTLDSRNCPLLVTLPLGKTPMFRESLVYLDLGFCNLNEVPDNIGELRCLERLNLAGNNFVSLPHTFNGLSSLAYLNLSHCHGLECLPELPSSSASSAGTYFKTVSQSRNHRSGLYMLDCANLKVQPSMRRGMPPLSMAPEYPPLSMALEWLTRLVKEPRHFRCGFDIVIPWCGGMIPWGVPWTVGPIRGSIRVMNSYVDDDGNCIGFAFCVPFVHTEAPLYLSFESENAEECFHMPFQLDLDKIQASELKHLWLIYISWPHCHFVKTGARITFKSGRGLKVMRGWGLRRVFKQQIEMHHLMESKKENFFQEVSEHKFSFELAYRRCESSSGPCGSKIQLPYNWFVTEEEENEKMEAEEKENNLSNVGF